MTKAEMLKDIAEIPEDAEVLAYHITIRTEKGQGTKGSITANGMDALLHVGSALNHVTECINMDMKDAADLMLALYRMHKKQKEQNSVKIDAEALAKLLGGGKDDE